MLIEQLSKEDLANFSAECECTQCKHALALKSLTQSKQTSA